MLPTAPLVDTDVAQVTPEEQFMQLCEKRCKQEQAAFAEIIDGFRLAFEKVQPGGIIDQQLSASIDSQLVTLREFGVQLTMMSTSFKNRLDQITPVNQEE